MMTPDQRRAARHALGLVGPRLKSYRNRYVCHPASADYLLWRAMEKVGHAFEGHKAPTSEFHCFHLTLAGAEAALNPGETLDPEDFPPDSKEFTHA